MITMSNFGNNGRLANQLFQYASLIGFSKKYNTNFYLPDWKYKNYFEKCIPQGAVSLSGNPIKIAEPHFHYSPEYFDQFDFKNKNYDFTGYFQSEKYWQHCKEEIIQSLKLKKEFVQLTKSKYESLFEKETVSIHIRRGDYVGNKFYYQLPITYFILALFQIPNWKEKNILVFSDDSNYSEFHFNALPNVTVIKGNSDIEDLCLMSLCDNHVLSNSSYSWWGAYLSKSKKVIYPAHYFTGNLKTDDLWFDSWVKFDHTHKKIDLTDTTFMIPLQYDHKDRIENINLNFRLLCMNFECEILIGENISDRFTHLTPNYFKFNYVGFHRTRILNHLASKSKTPIIVNWDADVFSAPLQIYQAVEMIRNGSDVVYPYDGTFQKAPRKPCYSILEKTNDLASISKINCNTTPGSFGGAVFFKKESYFEAGGENENFISWGPEDGERYIRFTKLGYKVERVKGSIYHMEHYRGPNSSHKNPYKAKNKREYELIASISKEELKEYINTWKHKTKSI